MTIFSSKNLFLITELVKNDFKIRYQQNVLGYFWSLIKPASMFFIMLIVFTQVIKVGANNANFTYYLLVGIMVWNYFSEGSIYGMRSMVDNGHLIKKINLNRYNLVISSIISSTINYLLSLIIILIIISVTIGWQWVLNIHYILIYSILITIIVSIASFVLSVLYARYRDIQAIWELCLQIGFYSTPIVYQYSAVPHRFSFILYSPIAIVIFKMRQAILGREIINDISIYSTITIISCAIILLILLIISLLLFKSLSKHLAEKI